MKVHLNLMTDPTQISTLNIYFNLTEKGVLVPVSELIKRLVPYKNEYSGYSSLDNLTSMSICVNFVPET